MPEHILDDLRNGRGTMGIVDDQDFADAFTGDDPLLRQVRTRVR